MSARSLYLVDDNADFLHATRFWLEAMGLTVNAWSDPRKAIDALTRRDRRKPACLMLDIRMPELSGLDVHDALVTAHALLPIIYISGHASVPLAVQAMQKGAVTLLEKPFDENMLGTALDHAFSMARDAGGTGGSQTTITPGRDGRQRGTPPEPESSADIEAQERFVTREASLSPREREVLGYVIEGVYNKNIADQLGLSIKTVELYRARGMAKMQARSVAELTRMMVCGRARS